LGFIVFSSDGQDSKKASGEARMNLYSFYTEAAGEKARGAFERGCSSAKRNLYRIRRIRVAQWFQVRRTKNEENTDAKVTESCSMH
jgi:hypothetical protein